SMTGSADALQAVMRHEAELNAAPKSTIEKSGPTAAKPQISSPNESHLVTPRSQSPSRRKPQTPASEDWFASHGKFIAIAFVLALIGTVYFARTNRRKGDGVAAAQLAQPAAPAPSSASKSPESNPADSAGSAKSKTAEGNSLSVAEGIPAKTESKTELHA